MARLPVDHGDPDVWGEILNTYLTVGHNPDGTHNIGTTLSPGLIQLSGDLSGNAWSPVVTAIHGVAVPSSPAAGQYLVATSPTTAAWQSPTSASTVNVRDAQYGATGNGTTDDTVAIDSALTAAGSGGVVYFPAGTYLISAALSVPSSVTLHGDGVNSTVIKQSSTSANAVTAVSSTALKIADMQFYGPSSGTGVGISISGSPTSYAYLRNVRVAHFGSDGIDVVDPIVSRFDNVVSALNSGHGFNIGGASAGSGGTSCAFTACYALANTQAGFYLNNLQYSNLSGCASDSNGTGFYLNACIGLTLTGCGAESCQVSASPWVGNAFVINGGYGNAVIGAFVYQNAAVSYWVTGAASKILLQACSDNAPTGTATNSISVDSGCGVTVLSPTTTSANSYSSTTQLLNDGSGNLQTWGEVLAKTSGAVGLATMQGVTATSINFIVTPTGQIQIGSGAATVDTQIARTGAGALSITNRNTSGGASLTVDGPVTAAGVVFPGGAYLPADLSFIAWAYDPASTTNSTLTVSGTIYLARVIIRTAQTLAKLSVGVVTAASGVTASQNFLGLYSSTGSLVASTASGAIDTALTSSGILTASLSSSYAAAAGAYWVAFVNNATTAATLARASGSSLSISNGGAAAGSYRFAVNGTGQTSLPGSITPGSNTAGGAFTMWAAAS